MSFASLPGFGRSSELVPQWLREEALYQKTLRKLQLPYRLLLLLVFAGMVGYLFWMVAAVANLPPPPRPLVEAIVGKWDATDGSGYNLEFTSDGQLTICRHGQLSIRGSYILLGEGAVGLTNAKNASAKVIRGHAEFRVMCADDTLVVAPPDLDKLERHFGRLPFLASLFDWRESPALRFARRE